MSTPHVAVLDYGSGNVHSVCTMLERAGARVSLTAQPQHLKAAQGLLMPGVGNFHHCMRGLQTVGAPELIAERVAANQAVLGVCVGLQVLFTGSTEPAPRPEPGLDYWHGEVSALKAQIVPHMGWTVVGSAPESQLFAGLSNTYFYFVHSYAARQVNSSASVLQDYALYPAFAHHGERFLAAVEQGPLAATQFHPEKSGAAGEQLFRNWLGSF